MITNKKEKIKAAEAAKNANINAIGKAKQINANLISLIPVLNKELKALESLLAEGVTPSEAALETTSPEIEVDAATLKKDDFIKHPRFGKGKVTDMEGSGADQIATIFFPHHGSKTIYTRFLKNITIEQSAREKVIEENFEDIIKALTANPIMQGDEFIGKEKC